MENGDRERGDWGEVECHEDMERGICMRDIWNRTSMMGVGVYKMRELRRVVYEEDLKRRRKKDRIRFEAG